MSIISNQNGEFPVKKNDIIFCEGELSQSLMIIIQGKADVLLSPLDSFEGIGEDDILKKSCKIASLGQNAFIGVNELLLSDKYFFSCRASEDSRIYVLNAQRAEQIKSLIGSKTDYAVCILDSASAIMNSCHAVLNRLKQLIKTLHIVTANLAVFFWLLKEKQGFSRTPSSKVFKDGLVNLDNMKAGVSILPYMFDAEFMETDHSDLFRAEFTPSYTIDARKMEYYKHLSSLPLEVRRSFLGADPFITEYHCEESGKCLREIQSKTKAALKAAEEYITSLYSEGDECIFSEYVQAAVELRKASSGASEVLHALDYILQKIKEVSAIYENEYGRNLEINISYLESVVAQAKRTTSLAEESSSDGNSVKIIGGMESIPDELKDSTEKILRYADIPRERADLFMANLIAFRNLKDKLDTDTESRNIRRVISSVFFEIYEAVFKKAEAEKNAGRLHHMFLSYGYMDENLLSPQHTIALYELAGKPVAKGQYSVYNMRDWARKIYTREKAPSLNEFGQDYYDVFREMKKRGEITDKEKPEYDSNVDKRLKHEIHNMFRINHRLCHGQINSYFPILHDDMVTRDFPKALVTPAMIEEAVNRILEVDFSAFHREIFYQNPEKAIEKESIMKPFPPDFILMPTFGTRAVMWQELTGRNRSSPGRFILPIFTTENLESLMLKLIGNFRWELCKTMMGVAWLDVTQSSLTSDYTDYIQFYKKNNDLSEEDKDKINEQIQKHRNMTREIFTSDYEIWVNYESKGNVRLNKVVRGILYKHCPFSKPIREHLQKQPMYSDIASRFENIRAKKAREFEAHYRKFTKDGSTLDPDLEHNLIFYRDM